VRRRSHLFQFWVVVAILGLLGVPTEAVGAAVQTSEEAAQAIIDARTRANRAADELAAAEAASAVLTDEIAVVRADVEATSARLSSLETAVGDLALQRFISGDSSGLSLLSGLDGPTEQVEADILAEVANNTSSSSIDEFDAVRSDLLDKQAILDAKQAELIQNQATLEVMRERAEEQIDALTELREQLLQDEAVARALAAKEALLRKQAAEENARQEARRAAAAEAEAAASAAASPNTGSSGGSGSSGSSGSSGGSSGSGSSGAAGGGGTTDDEGGGGGAVGGCGSNCAYVDTDIVCPVSGASAFGDTWGAPRSGGRRHQGVDMLGSTGTPLVAVVSGTAQQRQNSLGGNAVWVIGNNGNKYYYAHLDAFEKGGAVEQGDVIGYLGDTGNARGTPHLHFEVHPGGGAAVNPYPSVRAAC
jgi:murein DD-endopeptidase MepM/ murein hydrolase activator NlpD